MTVQIERVTCYVCGRGDVELRTERFLDEDSREHIVDVCEDCDVEDVPERGTEENG